MFWNSFSLRLLFVPKLRRAVPRNQVRWRIPRFNLCLPSLLQPHWEEIGPLSLTSRNIHSSFCKSSNGQFISCFILYLWLILAFSNTFKLLNGRVFRKPLVLYLLIQMPSFKMHLFWNHKSDSMSTRDSDLLTCSFMSVSNWIHLLTHAMLMSLLFFSSILWLDKQKQVFVYTAWCWISQH